MEARNYHNQPIEMDDKNLAILSERRALLDAIKTPRVGDWLILPDGKYTRFTHEWDDTIQIGGEGGSFYLGRGYCSYSGGLSPGVPKEWIEATNETKPGSVWFFGHDDRRAYNGVYTKIPFRVYRMKRGDQDV